MNERGKAIVDRSVPLTGRESVTVTLANMGRIGDAEDTMAEIETLTDEELTDATNAAFQAAKGCAMFAELLGVACIQRFEFTAEDVLGAAKAAKDLSVVQEALGNVA